MAYLLAVNGPHAGRRFDLSREVVTIGRHENCDVPLPEVARISRHHAQIVRDGDNYFLIDLDSRNGTYLNDERLKSRLLRHGDHVALSDMLLVFKKDAPPEMPETPGRLPEQPGRTTDDGVDTGVLLVDDEEGGSTCLKVTSKIPADSSSNGGFGTPTNLLPRFNALIEITRNLGHALALDDVLPQVLNSLFNIFGQADRGFIVLQQPDGELVPRWRRVRQPGSEDTIRVSRTIIRYVMCSKEAILSADATLDARLQTSQSIAALRLRSVMCAPLLDSEGRPLGVIQLDTLEQQKKFLPTDLEVLASVAVQAGVAIHNAQLHEHALRQKALEQDLSLAYRVQKGFLPQRRPEYPGYEFYDFYEPANHVGGDYYDYILLPDGRTAVVVADVVGHGFAAAMLMANLAAEAKYCLASEAHPATALRKLNDRLRSIHTDRFVTLILAVLNPTTHEVTVVNAGHMPPIWRRVDGTLVELGTDKGGMPLGILEGYPYQQETIRLEPGDVLFMYTDGIHEAMNPAGEQYSLARVRRQLLAGGCGVRALSQALIADVRQFVSPAAPSDDMCLVGVTRQ